jgi:hypothetical protein
VRAGRLSGRPEGRGPARGFPVSQNSTVWPAAALICGTPDVGVDVVPGEPDTGDGTNAIDAAGACGGWSRRIP